jgi:acetyl esterase/lipase
MNRFFCIILAFALIPTTITAETITEQPAVSNKTVLLWPEGAPGAKGTEDGDKPSLTIYLPPKDKANGTAVVICPGGGYGHLAMDHEGHQIAQWLNSLGVAGFILKYRHRNSGAGYGHPAPLLDAQRAVSTVRSRAKEWNVNPDRIGILGFSAGGHLASTAGTHFHRGKPDAKDPIDRAGCRPDFMVLIYPVISMIEWCAHSGSRRNLLGNNPDEKLVENLSNERQVTPETPPTFLVHTHEDKGVPAENSIYFYLALRKAKVPAEMHLYQKGPHGFGLGQNHGAVKSWPKRCADWMRGLGLLDKQSSESKQK